jgi:hypothetical protein
LVADSTAAFADSSEARAASRSLLNLKLVVLGIEFGNQLSGTDAVAYLHREVQDLALDTEAQPGLHTGLGGTGKRANATSTGSIHLLVAYGSDLRRRSSFLAAASDKKARQGHGKASTSQMEWMYHRFSKRD